MAQRRNWTRDEVIRAIALYLRTPFGRIHSSNREIMALAAGLDRSPGSVALKLANLASLDETLDRKGMGNASRLDRETWEAFFADPEAATRDLAPLVSPSEAGAGAPGLADAPLPFLRGGRVGEDIPVLSRARRGQSFFRTAVLTAYGGRCALTGIAEPELLIASHIEPWAEAHSHRLDPCNGLCLNALHDRAFDRGLITFDADWRLRLSPQLDAASRESLTRIGAAALRMPERFRPSQARMEAHRARHQDKFAA